MGVLSYKGNDFLMDGKPYRILSGAIHYFRVVPDYWEDRLLKLKACGFNTVETYVCWNLHERKEGVFNFSGFLDLGRYIDTAKSLGLHVILRPGPFICSEWDMGGLPSWLLKYKGMRLRCYDRIYLDKVERYLNEVCKIIKPRLALSGGNIIAVQIENEYGSYGNDTRYMEAIAEIYRRNNIDCLMFTSDGPGCYMLNGGSLPDILASVNFGSNPKGNFKLFRKYRPGQPLFCCEYWNGWFDHWFEEHHVRDGKDAAYTFDEILSEGASVNFYMFHGGTNFGFCNGANYDGKLQPTVTSYDYDAPVSESGDLTPKYYEIRKVVEKHFGTIPEIPVANLPKKAYGKVSLTERADLFTILDDIQSHVESSYPMTMEELGQDFGFVLYRTRLAGPFESMELAIDGLHDRALIYLDGKLLGIQDRLEKRMDMITIGLDSGEEACLDILVENLGRINYGTGIWDEKGITGGVRIGPQYHFGYKCYPLPFEDLSGIKYGPAPDSGSRKEGPVFLRGTFRVEEAADTFVRIDGFTKGNVYINGFNLGRYWNEAGPQRTLYLPAPLLKKGTNEIVILELEQFTNYEIILTDKEDLG